MNSTTNSATSDCDLRIRAYKICRDHLGGAWTQISANEMSFSPVSGGLSNLLICCALPKGATGINGEPNQVLLRLYGEENPDMSTQVEIFKLLSLKDLGPKLYSSFDTGRLEEFLPAISLTNKELLDRDISCVIARKLASVHSLDVPMMKERNWLLNRLCEWKDFIDQQPKEPFSDDEIRQSTREIARELMATNFGEEIKFLRSIFDKTSSPIVFSHNDLHQGNILLSESSKRRPTLDKRVIFIDFEYCSYNYRAYDIANHFCEWCFDYNVPDYPHFGYFDDRFPSKDTQLDFFRHYIQQRKFLAKSTSILSTSNGTKEAGPNGFRVPNFSKSNQNSPEEEALYNEVKPFFMAVSLFWTLWSMKSAHKLKFKFGYWEHAMLRWKLYHEFKSTYLMEQIRPAKVRKDNKSSSNPSLILTNIAGKKQ